MADDAIRTVMMRTTFYRDSYRRVLATLLFAILVIAGLSATLIYMFLTPSTPVYFATSADGKIIQLQPLNRPYIGQNDLLQWVTTAAVASFSYNFNDYRKSLTDTSEYFTPDAWKSFMGALGKTKLLDTVVSKKLIVTAVATAAPSIVEKTILNGRYTWKISLPILVTFQGLSGATQQAYVIMMNVIRVSSLDYPKGIAISQFIASQGSSS